MGEELSVASVVYNLAGDINDRPDYLKSLIVQHVMSGRKTGMAKSIQDGLINGPAMRLRTFYRWCQGPGNYNTIGFPTGSLEGADDALDLGLIEVSIPHPDGTTVTVQNAELDNGNAIYWAERWIADNRPAALSSNWRCSINEDGTLITILFPSGTPIEVIPVLSPGFSAATTYLFARYTRSDSPTVQRRYIYGIGSGIPALDELVSSASSYGSFFPFIPVRRNNKFLSKSYHPTPFAQTNSAYNKVMNGGRLKDLTDSLKENPDLKNIDYAYIVFGVALNTKDNDARKYLYTFFDSLRDLQVGGPATSQTAKNNKIRIAGKTTVSKTYDIRLEWRYVREETGAGLGKPGAKVGELWFEKVGTVSGYQRIRLYWQRTADSYTYLSIVGLVHRNYVYQSKAVIIKAWKALDDSRESGFIVPLHYDIWRQTPLKSTSQMASSCMYIVFNCYEVYERPWWDNIVFKIFLVVAIAVVGTVLTGGVGAAGLLGSSAALGSALGFTGLTAAIVGSVVNALAAMVLVSLLEPMIRKVAGPATPVIMAILMFAIGSAASSMSSTGSLAINWSDLLRVDNLLMLTDAIGRGVTMKIQEDTMNLQQQQADILKNALEETQKIQQAFLDQFGYGSVIIDPLMLTGASQGPIAESSDTFLTRTLMTGSEIAEMSQELLYEFPTHSLTLPGPFT